MVAPNRNSSAQRPNQGVGGWHLSWNHSWHAWHAQAFGSLREDGPQHVADVNSWDLPGDEMVLDGPPFDMMSVCSLTAHCIHPSSCINPTQLSQPLPMRQVSPSEARTKTVAVRFATQQSSAATASRHGGREWTTVPECLEQRRHLGAKRWKDPRFGASVASFEKVPAYLATSSHI